MKKVFGFIFCILILASTNSHAVVELGWTTEMETRWAQMYNENHTIWQRLKQEADLPNNQRFYFDRGLREALVYKITGDVSYATRAYERYAARWCGITWNGGRDSDPTWCSTEWAGKIPADGLREDYIRLARMYSWIAPALNSTDRANFKDILTLWKDKTLADQSEFGTRPSDSDQVVGAYLGLMVFAKAIQYDDPTLYNEIMNFPGTGTSNETPPTGGLTSTGSNYATLRNTITRYAENAEGGEWLEGSNYNLGTVALLLTGVEAINSVGTDYFPEITALYDDFSDNFVEQVTPDISDSYSWGDEQNPKNIYPFTRGPIQTLVTKLGGDDPRGWYIFDILNSSIGNMHEDWYLYVDPYADREVPTGYSTNNSSPGRGITYYHEGWNTNDSFFISAFFREVGVDHSVGGFSNFNLWKNDGWVLYNPRGYYGHWNEDAPYQNTILVNGGISHSREAKGPTAYESSSDYVYHSGATGGQMMWGGLFWYDTPAEIIHEWNRSHLFVENSDGTSTLFVFDRLNSNDPTDTNYQPDFRYVKIPQPLRYRIENADSKHQYIVNVNEPVTVNGNEVNWTAINDDEVYWNIYMDSTYSHDEFRPLDYLYQGPPYYIGGSMENSELNEYQHRLVINTINGFQTMFNVFNLGSNPTTTHLTDFSGEAGQAVIVNTGSNRVLAIFNGQYNTPPAPTPASSDGKQYNDPNKLNEIKKLRYFKTGFEVSIPSDGTVVDIFIADLDPNRTWTATLGGTSISGFTVSSEGLARFTMNKTAGNYLLNVSSTSVCSSSDWRGCNTQSQCQTNGWYWYNSTCNQTTETSCNTDASLCQTQNDCISANWYWYNDVCNTSPQEAVCDSDNFNLCTTEGDCSEAGGYWYNDQCNSTAQSSCSNTPSLCTNQIDCENASWYWYNSQCNTNPSGSVCDFDNLNLCTTQQECTTVGGYWYGTPLVCNSSPNSGSVAMVTITAYEDARIQGGSDADINFDTSGLRVRSISPDYDWATLLRFNLNAIPAGSVITEVLLKLTLSSNQEWNIQNYVHPVLRDWIESEVTWNQWKTGSNWSSPGARSNGEDIDGSWGTVTGSLAYISQQTRSGGEVITYTSNSTFVDFLNSNIGDFVSLIIQQENLDNSGVFYYDSENGDSALSPSLEITYITPSGPPGEDSGEEPTVIFTTGGGSIYGYSIVP